MSIADKGTVGLIPVTRIGYTTLLEVEGTGIEGGSEVVEGTKGIGVKEEVS